MRNSSLVKRACADNVTGLKHNTEAWDFMSNHGLVGERCHSVEGRLAKTTGVVTSENGGMSSEKSVRTRFTESLRVPTQGQSASGESGLSRGRNA